MIRPARVEVPQIYFLIPYLLLGSFSLSCIGVHLKRALLTGALDNFAGVIQYVLRGGMNHGRRENLVLTFVKAHKALVLTHEINGLKVFTVGKKCPTDLPYQGFSWNTWKHRTGFAHQSIDRIGGKRG